MAVVFSVGQIGVDSFRWWKPAYHCYPLSNDKGTDIARPQPIGAQ